MNKVFRGEFLRWIRIWYQNWRFRSFKWYKRRKRLILSKIKHLKMMHIILLSPLPKVETLILTPDSEKAWKFTSKNLLHTSVYCCFQLKRLQCVKTLNFGFFEKWPVSTVSTVFKPKIPKSDTGFGSSVKIHPRIRTPYAFLSLFSGDTATSENFEISKSRGLVILTTGLT